MQNKKDKFVKYEDAPSNLRVNWEEMLSEIREARNEFGKVVEEVVSEVKVVKDEKTGMIESIKEIMSKGLEKESEETQGVLDKYLFGTKNKLKDDLEQIKDYYEQREQIKQMYTNKEEQDKALYLFDSVKQKQLKESLSNKNSDDSQGEDGLVGDLVGDAFTELEDGLSEMLTDFDHFGENFKKIGQNIADSMVKTVADALIKIVIKEETATAAIEALHSLWNLGGGLLGFGKNVVKSGAGFLSRIFKFHSGGVIPSDANYSLRDGRKVLQMRMSMARVA